MESYVVDGHGLFDRATVGMLCLALGCHCQHVLDKATRLSKHRTMNIEVDPVHLTGIARYYWRAGWLDTYDEDHVAVIEPKLIMLLRVP